MRQHASKTNRFQRRVLVVVAFGLLVGCNRESQQAEDANWPAIANPPQESLQLPVSLNEVMVALVNHAADPIWMAAWRNPENDKDWRNLERMAYQLEVAGAILVIPGTGPHDAAWAQDPVWRQWSRRLRQTGEEAVQAVAARDLARISAVGDELVEICEGCHKAFKPAEPTGGKFGELSPTAVDIEETNRRE